MKKIAGYIIILHMCTKNHNHDLQFLRYGVGRTGCFVILDNFLPCAIKSQKIKILKKWEKHLEVL